MKRMELKITLTFVIMFVVGVIINGIYNVISKNSNFITFEVVANGIFNALVYLGYIWLNTRRHQLLASLGICCCVLYCGFIAFSLEGVNVMFDGWNWDKTIIFCIYYMISYLIASYQAKKLIEEDTLNIKFFVNVEEIDKNNS